MRISPERFDALVYDLAADVLHSLPPELRAEARQVILDVADRPTPEQDPGPGYTLLGLYEGLPLVERSADSALLFPERITLFREPLQALARTEAELKYHVRQTLIHELGHFFGFDEDELQARGWG